jgi:predicted RNA-binding Zn-ribbon protein involved in translation (DUF1610 family)
MEFVVLKSFDNYMDAHIVMGRLEEEGIRCWLRDETTVTVTPYLSNALGGIKIMVVKDQYERALTTLQEINAEKRSRYKCPNCGSSDIELITTPRKPATWLGALGGFFFGDYPLGVAKVWRCFNCHSEFDEPKEMDHS